MDFVFSKRPNVSYDLAMTQLIHDKLYYILNKYVLFYYVYFDLNTNLYDYKNNVVFKLYKRNKENLFSLYKRNKENLRKQRM